MAVPKKKISSARRGSRAAHHALKSLSASLCSHCKEPKLPHHVCPACGYYKGREAIEITSDE